MAGNEGNPEALRHWYDEGAKDQIDWGSPGDFMRCVGIASKYMTDEQAKGFCNLRHQDATGAPPGHAPGEEKAKTASLVERVDSLTAAVLALGLLELGDISNEARDSHGRWSAAGVASEDIHVKQQDHPDVHSVNVQGKRVGSVHQTGGFVRGHEKTYEGRPHGATDKKFNRFEDAVDHVLKNSKDMPRAA